MALWLYADDNFPDTCPPLPAEKPADSVGGIRVESTQEAVFQLLAGHSHLPMPPLFRPSPPPLSYPPAETAVEHVPGSRDPSVCATSVALPVRNTEKANRSPLARGENMFSRLKARARLICMCFSVTIHSAIKSDGERRRFRQPETKRLSFRVGRRRHRRRVASACNRNIAAAIALRA